jgi:hypothetical protein
VSPQDVLLRYEDRIAAIQTGLEQTRLHSGVATIALVMMVALVLLLGALAVRQRISLLWPSLPVPLAAALASRLGKYRDAQSRGRRLRAFYDRAVARVRGCWVGQGATGMEFHEPAHLYAGDLHVFGEGSLFELICVARTGIGQRGLAEYLKQGATVAESRRRQEAVRELSGQTDLRERLASLGRFDFAESTWETFSAWLDSPALVFPRYLRAVLLTSVLLLVVLAALAPWPLAAPGIVVLVAFHAAVGLRYRDGVRSALASLGPVSVEIEVLREGLELLAASRFRSAKLRELAEQTRGSAERLRRLERMLDGLQQRNKEWFFVPSLFLMVATQLCLAIEDWRVRHGASLRIWIDAWGEFEALHSLANYADENPGHVFPSFSPANEFVAAELGHPLLPDATCVRNDVGLNGESRFYVVSGSNMSGKSTLMRAIGLNAVLAYCGAPVRAKALRLSNLSICASLSVVDSLLQGKSKFMAEMERLRRTIEVAVAGQPVLFLIDEILSGTNSPDRRVAAEAIVRTLVTHGAIGVLSTHDLALTEMASPALGGVNVHTGSRDGSDPLDFDYRLKPGITNESNALAIARMAGVPV